MKAIKKKSARKKVVKKKVAKRRFSLGAMGLKNGQSRPNNRLVNNGLWYNQKGKVIGRGDLSGGDFVRIQEELQKVGRFYILPSNRDLRKLKKKLIGRAALEYVLRNCVYVVLSKGPYILEDKMQRFEKETSGLLSTTRCGVRFHIAKRARLKKFILEGQGYLF